MKKKKQKKFSSKTMDVSLKPLVSIGIYRAVKKKTTNISEYIRNLIMNDLNIDELGHER